MLVRYTKDKRGRARRQAVIYTPKEHSIPQDQIDPDATKIARRLHTSGHHAYIVGGAVRDLLIGNTPKDFDIATDAQPNRIRRLFRNSRVIGRRFRLVHIFFGPKIIEVSTFRSETSAGFQNEYGDIEEDVFRRDFTMNALYYNPVDGRIIDYVGGVKDIRDRKIRPVIPLERIFVEDPVRMIRAIKYSVSTGFRLVGRLRRQIKRSSEFLADTPPSRMTEEVFKILVSGNASGIFRECLSYKLLRHMVPTIAELANQNAAYRERLIARLAELDREVREAGEDRRSRGIAYLCGDYLFEHSDVGRQERIVFVEAFAELKKLIRPLVPANKDVEMALVYLIRRRKNYKRSGVFEVTPPSERPRQEDEPWRGEAAEDGPGTPTKKRRRRSRRPRSRSGSDRTSDRNRTS
ncbi:MAG: polynucleotide adenylyltransferase PcnB [Spirochaetota bacterium]